MLTATIANLILQIVTCEAVVAGAFADKLQAFATSEIEFQRGDSRVPFPPIAYFDVQRYGDAELEQPPLRDELSVNQTSVSQGVLLPFLMSPRDALVIGEWASWSRFEPRGSEQEDFDVVSVAAPVGWLHQASPSWQMAAFVAPLGHKADLPRASWTWETMGGVFGRRIQNDNVWWAVGFFADVGPGDDLYLPYAGASWSISPAWTLSAVLPWPAVLWAPTDGLLFRLGAAPSGTSWQLDAADAEVSVDLSTLDLGLSAEKRLRGNVWGRLEVGVGGFRALSIAGDDWQNPGSDSAAAAYVTVGINFRPALPNSR